MAFIIPQTWEQALQSKEKGESREQTVDIVQYWICICIYGNDNDYFLR